MYRHSVRSNDDINIIKTTTIMVLGAHKKHNNYVHNDIILISEKHTR